MNRINRLHLLSNAIVLEKTIREILYQILDNATTLLEMEGVEKFIEKSIDLYNSMVTLKAKIISKVDEETVGEEIFENVMNAYKLFEIVIGNNANLTDTEPSENTKLQETFYKLESVKNAIQYCLPELDSLKERNKE